LTNCKTSDKTTRKYGKERIHYPLSSKSTNDSIFLLLYPSEKNI